MFQQLSVSPTPACNDNGSFFSRRGRARMFKLREFIAVARFDAGQHVQLVLDRWLQVGWIPQV